MATTQADSLGTAGVDKGDDDAAVGEDSTVAQAVAANKSKSSGTKSDGSPVLGLLLGLGAVLLLVLSGPVLATIFGGFPSAIINAIIVGFALQKAWQMGAEGDGSAATAQGFTGPYKVAAQQPSAAQG